MRPGYHWRAIGIFAASLGAASVVLLDHKGYHTEARMLAVAGLLFGGTVGAVKFFVDAENEHRARLVSGA